jgi:hypothetical protein
MFSFGMYALLVLIILNYIAVFGFGDKAEKYEKLFYALYYLIILDMGIIVGAVILELLK